MAGASWKWYSNLDENEKTALEDELNEFTKLSKSDTKEERLIDLSKKEAQEQPDVGRIIESIAKMTWQEHSGLKYNGSGFLGKLMLGEGYRLGYFTAGHNLFDEGTQQVVNPKSVKLLFKNIRKYTIPILLSKLMCKPNILIVAYKNNKITIKEGKTHIQSCRDGIDFAALIFTGKIQVTEKFLRKKGLSFLNIGEPGTCGSKPNSPVQLYGFPQYIPDSMDEVISDSPMRILPGVELAAPAGNIPFHYYTLETKPGASGASISNKGGRVIAIHIRGLNKDRDEKGNWGIGFDIIREELLQCPDISSLASKAEPGTSDPHKTQGMLPALGKFLKNIGLEQYISSFEAEDIDMEVLEKCEHEELGQVLKEVGVTLGHKKKITEALQALHHEKRQIKEQMEKEQEREKDLLENVDANMFIKGLDSYTNAVERGETTFKVKVKDPNAPVDFYINGKKVSKSDTRCKYVNVGEGKHQLILHNIKMEDMGTIEARTPSNRGDEMLTSSTECEVAMGEHAPEVGDCGPVTGIPNKECRWKLPYKCEGVQQSPLEVTVMFRGKELKIGLDVNVIIHQGNIELSVINPKREKSGIYTVTMKNAQGESSRDINVNIMGVNETAAASNVKMSCGVIIGIIVAVIAVIAQGGGKPLLLNVSALPVIVRKSGELRVTGTGDIAVFAIGGGAGGYYGNGGGSGYIAGGTIHVKDGDNIEVVIGRGGGLYEDGGTTTMQDVVARGGKYGVGEGGEGWSGGGGVGSSSGGRGGAAGQDGEAGTGSSAWPGGSGQRLTVHNNSHWDSSGGQGGDPG